MAINRFPNALVGLRFLPRAFSLVELLVALSIVAVVGAIVVPRFLDVRAAAAKQVRESNAKTIQKGISDWFSLGGWIRKNAFISGGANAPTATCIEPGPILYWLSNAGNGNSRPVNEEVLVDIKEAPDAAQIIIPLTPFVSSYQRPYQKNNQKGWYTIYSNRQGPQAWFVDEVGDVYEVFYDTADGRIYFVKDES